ncbi:MAG: hypothetical protein ACK5D0_00450 [Burkholderiaceae bacterium]|jgi:hypothetical protein
MNMKAVTAVKPGRHHARLLPSIDWAAMLEDCKRMAQPEMVI